MKRSIATSLALGALVAPACPLSAHFAERQASISGYVHAAKLVVAGTVVSIEQRIENGHATGDGNGVLRVESTLKTDVPIPEELRFQTTGVHQGRYKSGDRVLLFLEAVANVDPPAYLTRQNTVETIELGGENGDAVVAAVRETVDIERSADPAEKVARSKDLTLRLLESKVPALWQNGLFDLSSRADLRFDAADVARIGAIALGQDRAPVLRVGCVTKLRDLGRDDGTAKADAVATLEKIVADPSGGPLVRSFAVTALRETGAPSARATLLPLLGDSSTAVRQAAAEALGQLGGRDLVAKLAGVVKTDADAHVRIAALKAIDHIGGAEADRFFTDLEKSAKDPEMVRVMKTIHPPLVREAAGRPPQGRNP